MDRFALTVRLLRASIAGAGWVAMLEAIALAVRGGTDFRSLLWIFVGTLYLSILPLVALAPIAFLVWPRIAHRVSERAAAVLGVLAIAGSVALHAANTSLYVRLYASIHMTLTVLTLGSAYVGACWLVGFMRDRPVVVAVSPGAEVTAATTARRGRVFGLIALLLVLTLGAAFTLHRLIDDPVIRVDALERATVLAHELHALDAVTGILATEADTPKQGSPPIDSEVLASLAPAPILKPSGVARGAHVIWITIDSMRADRWLAGGAKSPLLPTLEALAAESTRFARAYTPSCWTIHSMSAALFGRLPSQLTFTHVAVDPKLNIFQFGDGSAPDPLHFKKATPAPYTDQGPGLIDQLRKGGYETATVVSYAFYLRDGGITRAFEHVDEQSYRELGPGATGLPHVPMVERAQKLLDARDKSRPFFLWLHFMDPHAPYEARDAQAEGASPPERYDSELRYVDAQLKLLQEAVQGRGMDENTLWVVHADHGEEFRDHGGEFHATTLYEEIVHVPLLMRMPSKLSIEPRTIGTPVGVLDIGPTLLDALGIETPHPFMGRSLLPAILTGTALDRIQIMECDRFAARKRAYVRWPFKLILDRALGTAQLFALTTDPREQRNLASQEAGLTTVLTAELNEIMQSLAPRKSSLPPAQPEKPNPPVH